MLKAGALDVCCMPLYMKKGRPAYLFQIICRPADEEVLKKLKDYSAEMKDTVQAKADRLAEVGYEEYLK